MINLAVRFAETNSSASGIGAFNINLKSFIFQLITFAIVLMVFRRWILPPITKTLEARRQTVEDSLVKAKKTEEALAQAEEKAKQILLKARQQADEALAEAKAQAKEVVSQAETAADMQAQRLIKEAEERLSQEHHKLRDQLKEELVGLVTLTTEKVLRRKLSQSDDSRLIEDAVKELARD